VNEASRTYPETWRERWSALARSSGLEPREPLLVALSGGADSVLLLHWLRASDPRPPVVAVHVDHGLRGAESEADARFCAELCRSLDIPFRLRRIGLDPEGPSLEERARLARYQALVEEARRAHVSVILTAHHSDDGLETLLMRWIRGSDLPGLAGLKPETERRSGTSCIRVVRPLVALRRGEIRRLLASAGLSWRDDTSNRDPRFTRNRVREVLLPRVTELAGPAAVDHLRAFADAVESLERNLADHTAELAWRPLRATRATRHRADLCLGGAVRRERIEKLPSALRRRALWRLVLEGTGRAPSKRLLDVVLADLEGGRKGRRALPGGWNLQLKSRALELHPPIEQLGPGRPAPVREPWLPFAELAGETELPKRRSAPWLSRLAAPEHGFVLPVPGSVTLPDGRRIVAQLIEADPSRPVPRAADVVELDAAELPARLAVRWPRPGDRFHPLGAPGSRALRRFLADAGVPRGERRLVPLVLAGSRILWCAGLRPDHAARIIAGSTARRLRLELHSSSRRESVERPAIRVRSSVVQRELFDG
jgi:tRNA(Ile)-lysidine synthase